MKRGTLTVLAIVGAVGALLLSSAVFTVHQSEQAMVLQFGDLQRIIDKPGINIKLPFMQDVVFFSKRVLNFDAPSEEVPTLDQKQVIVSSFARFRIVDPLLFYQAVHDEAGVQARLRPIVSSALRRILGDVPMSQILTAKRADLMRRIAESVNIEAQTFGINVIDVRMKRVDLPEENSQAIFRRMQTQREQAARRFRAEGAKEAQTLRSEADKQQVVILADAQRQGSIQRGEGEGEATRIYNEAYGRDPGFFDFYRSLQAMNEGLGGDNTTYVGPTSGDFFRFFGQQAAPAAAGQ
jgi:membrane protease subunit HflC